MYHNVKSSANIIGYTSLNPAWTLTDTLCGSYTKCTRADVMYIQPTDTSPSAYTMRIRATEEWDEHISNNSRSPRTIIGYWSRIEKVPFVVEGDTVYKVGRTSGVTGGHISDTCSTYPIGDVQYVCFHEISNAAGGPGDSGAPIFYPATQSGDRPLAIGIYSSSTGSHYTSTDASDFYTYSCDAGCVVKFSEWNAIEVHLSRYLSAYGEDDDLTGTVEGSSTAWQGAELTWSADLSGGYGPFWYSWAGFDGALSGSGSSVTFSPTGPGTVEFLAWDAYGNWAHASIEVTWCGEYAC